MSDEQAPKSKTGLIIGIVVVLVAVMCLLPALVIGGLTVMGSMLESSFQDVADQVEDAR